jgi:RNA polymerase sigma-70 factor (ECF subfamily)
MKAGGSERLKGYDVLLTAFTRLMAKGPDSLGLDAATLRDFYDQALPRVYGYFLHRCGGSVQVAEDLTQDTFLAAARELNRGRRIETPIAWIYGIAQHKLLDHYRRQARAERHLTVELDGEHEELALDVGDEDSRERAVAALASVATPQRAALVLCYLDGFSPAEVAAELGKSVAAVNSLLQRGRASFKRAYGEVST